VEEGASRAPTFLSLPCRRPRARAAWPTVAKGGRLDAITPSGNFVGTDRLGRALTDAENAQLAKLLRAHDYYGASVAANRFAHKLARSKMRADDLMGRTWVRFMCWGWDPNRVSLAKGLCRLVWSVHTHQKEETAAARRAEEVYLRHMHEEERALPHDSPARGDPLHPPKRERAVPSIAQEVVDAADEREAIARNEAEVAKLRLALPELRKRFVAASDEVNLLWLELRLAGTTDLAQMARDSKRDVEQFYAAAKRRKRMVRTVLAELTGEPEAKDDDDEENE